MSEIFTPGWKQYVHPKYVRLSALALAGVSAERISPQTVNERRKFPKSTKNFFSLMSMISSTNGLKKNENPGQIRTISPTI